MVANSKIEWTNHTFNPWVGCGKVSPACDHYYAEAWAKRAGHPELWQNHRRRTRPDNWAQPIKWDRAAAAAGERHRVFCASLADVFDNKVPGEWRADLFRLMRETPNLDWLLLTKRIGNATAMIDRALTDAHLKTSREPFWPWPNVWLGATICNQEEADRDIPKLLEIPAAIRFLSCEPMIAEIDITRWLWGVDTPCPSCPKDVDCECGWNTRKQNRLPSVDWVIAGGESGPGARPMAIEWTESLREQCRDAGVAFFMKQLGGVRDRRGELADLPESLRAREFPR